jgi:DDE family transposase
VGTSASVAREVPSSKAWLKVLSTLNERQARLFVAERALTLGRGGISQMSRLTGISRPTIMKGAAELVAKGGLPAVVEGRVRRPGGGRRKVEEVDPGLRRELVRIMEETTAGDPMSLLKWTSKSTRAIAEQLAGQGHPVSSVTVGRCLHDMDYSLQANVKELEGPQHPDRDAQFRYINARVKSFLRSHDPVISVDTKKKELVGAFRNAGRTWRPKGHPERVMVHDFPSRSEGHAIPYGTYDVASDRAVVNVGVTHDTAEFAVESIRRWWRLLGRRSYASAGRLLICADAGGSNGNRLRAWKLHLQDLADELRLAITVCHYPPGTSKWNKIEHRLFSFISMHWKGQPLLSYETIVALIGGTSTRSGLKVKAVLDTSKYRTGIKVSASEMNGLKLKAHAPHPEWNYTISSRR